VTGGVAVVEGLQPGSEAVLVEQADDQDREGRQGVDRGVADQHGHRGLGADAGVDEAFDGQEHRERVRDVADRGDQTERKRGPGVHPGRQPVPAPGARGEPADAENDEDHRDDREQDATQPQRQPVQPGLGGVEPEVEQQREGPERHERPDRVRPPGGRGPLGGQQDHHDDPDRGDVDRVQQRQAHQGEQQPHSHHGSCAPPPPDVPGALGVSVV